MIINLLFQIHKLTQSEDTLKADNEGLTKQVELLSKQLATLHEQSETVIALKEELSKAQDRIKILSSTSEANAEAASLIDAMQGLVYWLIFSYHRLHSSLHSIQRS